MHESEPPQATVAIGALPVTPLETSKSAPPRRRSKDGNVNGSSSSEPAADSNNIIGSVSAAEPSSSGKRVSISSDQENDRSQPREDGAAEVRENGIRTRRSISSAGEVGVPAPMDVSAAAAASAPEPAGDEGGENPAAGRQRKRRRQSKSKDAGAPIDEKTRISRRIKTMVNRIRLEQNLLDAYAGEGWKGNSREKIRPEKELQRAAVQILRCKLAIRDLIRELDNLTLDGSLEKSAFDEEGQIFHEEIFCAKCKSQETFTDNDIILCDGACDRGFHQNCVDPPLATADIPPGDEGWLCPVCESKVECLNYMNDFLGTDYQVEDHWEKVFASAAAANEQASNPSLGEDWPSEDSDDDDYDPDRKPIQKEGAEQGNGGGRSTLEKTFSELNALDGSASEPEASSGSGSGSGSDSSGDASGSSDCSGDELANPGPQLQRRPRRGDSNAAINNGSDPNDPIDVTLDLPTDAIAAAELEPVVPVSGKRQRNPVDYKSLHKEMFGEQGDDMLSEDEEWGPGRPGGRRVGGNKPAAMGLNGVPAKRALTATTTIPRPAMGDEQLAAPVTSTAEEHGDISTDRRQSANERAPKMSNAAGKTRGDISTDRRQSANERALKMSNAAGKTHGDISTDRRQSANERAPKMSNAAGKTLREEFESGMRFPTRVHKEDLAQRLGISFKQVNSWFKTARHIANRKRVARMRNGEGVGTAANGNTGREKAQGVDEMEMTNGLLVEKLDEVQLKLHFLKQTLEAMVANRDAGSQPNGKHILYVPVAEVVEKDVEIGVETGTV